MKIPGKFILKVAGTLTVISLVVAALLGFVNSITADKIAEIDAENTRIAMSAVAPEGSEFGDKIEVTDDMVAAAATQSGKILELYPVTNGGAEAGYVMKISASGSQGTIVMMVGVDANKAITGISVVSSAGGHNGLKNIIQHLGSDRFPRIKVGVGSPKQAGYEVVDWVIGMPVGEEQKTLLDALDRAAQAIPAVITQGMDKAMNRFN